MRANHKAAVMRASYKAKGYSIENQSQGNERADHKPTPMRAILEAMLIRTNSCSKESQSQGCNDESKSKVTIMKASHMATIMGVNHKSYIKESQSGG